MASVELKNICKVYPNSAKKSVLNFKKKKTETDAQAGDFIAVKDFNMEIEDGEFIVFVGPSGCGKSTTLRMIAGLEEISSGELKIGDTVVNGVEPKDRDIAMVFQNYALYPHMSIYENIAFGLRLRKIPDIKRDKQGNPVLDKNGNEIPVMRPYTKAEIDEKVQWAAGVLGITDYLKRKPKEMSGGQRQRVALGRAIVRQPKVMLLDEPLSNLDAKLRTQMRSEIVKLHKELKTTFIYVTHDQVEAMTMGTRIVVMKGGVIQQIGTPTEVFNHPENLFVSGFIGTPQMNYFDARLIKYNGEYCVELYGKLFKITNEMNAYLKEQNCPEKEIILGFRSEHFIPELKGGESGAKFTNKYVGADGKPAVIDVKVTVFEMMGSELYVHAVTEDDKQIIIRIPTMNLTAKDMENIENCGNLKLAFSPQFMHIFDKETEKNLMPLIK